LESITFVPIVLAGRSSAQKCEATIYKIIGGYIRCI
jgi:hypothetical protein